MTEDSAINRNFNHIALILSLTIAIAASCQHSTENNPRDAGQDTGAGNEDGASGDASADADADGDSDSDGDADTDADADGDAAPDGQAMVDGGNLIWVKSAGGTSTDVGASVAVYKNEAIYITGYYCAAATFGKGETNETVLESFNEGEGCDVFVARYNVDGTLTWAKMAGGIHVIHWNEGTSIATGPDGSVYVTGAFEGTAIFGEGGAGETSIVSQGDTDAFIAKYNPDGTLQWARREGGADHDTGKAVKVLQDGTVLVAGDNWDTAVIGAGEAAETTVPRGFFIAKYSADGKLLWAKGNGDASNTETYGLAVLPDGSFFITGYFISITFGKGEPTETHFETGGEYDEDIFIAKYNSDGTLAWAKRAGGPNDNAYESDREIGFDLSALSDKSALVTGHYLGPSVFGDIGNNQTTLEGSRAFIAKYDDNGDLGWVRGLGGSNILDYSVTFGLDRFNNDFVVTGWFDGIMTLSDNDSSDISIKSYGGGDIFFVKCNIDNACYWAKHAGSSDDDSGNDICFLPDGSFVIIGTYFRTAMFGEGEPNESSIGSVGDSDIFIARFSP